MSTSSEFSEPPLAWQPWQPTQKHPWNRRAAAHLHRRAGFGASSSLLNDSVTSGPQACVDRMLDSCRSENPETRAFDSEMDTMADGLVASQPEALEPWWLYRMLFTPAPLRERMTLFWHGHFATSAAVVQNTSMMLRQNQTLRHHALGRFEPIVQAISRDPAMLTYLNSTTNEKLHPNENYAREVMELFCLGVGNYTERDIQETARCFTGWEIRRGKFRFNKHQHDFGGKSILGQTGAFDGDDAVRIILQQDAAPRFIARKLVNHFCSDQPISDELIEPLADQLRQNDFTIEPVVRRILTSRYFYSQASIGQKIRSPIDLVMGILRCLEGATGTIHLARQLRPLGQRIFFPPNVKGWDGGRQWINATTLIGRVNLATEILRDEDVRFGGGDLATYVERLSSSSELHTSSQMVESLTDLLVAVPLHVRAQRELIEVAKRRRQDSARAAIGVLNMITALPEFQLA